MTRLKTGILVSAALRNAQIEMIDCVLERRGDADAGTIFLHLDTLDGRHKLLSRTLDLDGNYTWQVITKSEGVEEKVVQDRIQKELLIDQDAFVVVVFDRDARNPFV